MSNDRDVPLDRALAEGGPADDVGEGLARARLRDRLFGAKPEPVRIGRYTILDRLGAGANGVVFAAYDDRLDRKIALKILQPGAGTSSTRARGRLLNEAQALAKLSHPNIVTVFEVFVDEARDVVIAMEFVDGPTLGAWAAQPRAWTEVLAMYLGAADGLAAAHDAGMIHRDFKPSNAIVGEDGRVRLLDFGLVRLDPSVSKSSLDPASVELAAGPDEGRASVDAEANLEASTSSPARTGIVGTPLYMPPEQHEGRPADARSDQYSFCAALWEALLGEPPFPGRTLTQLHERKLAQPPSVPTEHEIPKRILEALARGLSPDPAHRFASMHELRRALHWNPAARRRRWFTALGIAAAAGAGVVYGNMAEDRPCAQVERALEEVWNPARAEAIGRAFARVDKPFAGPSWTTSKGLIDAWAGQWVDVRRDACLAHHDGTQSSEMLDLRSACLDARKLELQALLDLFEAVDAAQTGVVERSVQAARALPSLAACSDLDVLTSAVAPPGEPATRDAVTRLRDDLAHVRANIAGGRYEQAATAAKKVLAEIEAAPWTYDPVRAEALLAYGNAVSWTDQPQQALALLREGTLLAQRVGDTASFVRGATDLVWEFGDVRSEFEVAHTWADVARASLPAVGDDPLLAGNLHNNVGSVLADEQRYDEALAEHRARLQLVGERDGSAFKSLTNIANIYNLRGEWTDAVAWYERALAVATEDVGPLHPLVLMIRSNLLGVLWRTASLPEARAYGERLLADQRSVLGPSHPDLVSTYANLALIAERQDDEAAELAFVEEGLRRADVAYGPDSPYSIPLRLRLANLRNRRRDHAAAEAVARGALHIAIASRGPDHGDAAYAHETLGETLLYLGRDDEALGHFAEVRRIGEAAAPQELVAIAESYTAWIWAVQGRATEAAALAQTALERFERSGSTELNILIARSRVGQTLVDVGRPAEALAHLDETLRRFEALGDPPAASAAAFDRMRALVALGRAPKDPAAARALADRGPPLLLRRIAPWLPPGDGLR